MLYTFSIAKTQSKGEAKYNGKWFSNITWKKHEKTHDQEGGLVITMHWEMAQVWNMNHAYSQMEVRMKKKEISPCVSTHQAILGLQYL